VANQVHKKFCVLVLYYFLSQSGQKEGVSAYVLYNKIYVIFYNVRCGQSFIRKVSVTKTKSRVEFTGPNASASIWLVPVKIIYNI